MSLFLIAAYFQPSQISIQGWKYILNDSAQPAPANFPPVETCQPSLVLQDFADGDNEVFSLDTSSYMTFMILPKVITRISFR